MVRELPNPGMPRLFDQLAVLPPAVKLVVGAAMLSMGIGAIVLMRDSAYSWVLLAIGAVLGLPLKWQGLAELRERRVSAAELQRARQELPVLRAALLRLSTEKRGVERFLIERGYTSNKARRWIAGECGVVLPAGSA